MKKIYLIIFSFFIFLISPVFVFAATLSVSPAVGTFSVGDTVTARILVSSDTSLNAVSANVLFPPSLFSITSISKNSSILNFWVTEPSFSAATGIVHFEGVVLNGYSGSGGTVIVVTLRALKAGSGKVSFQTAQILANDGQGTDITGSLNGANFSIKEASVKTTPAIPTPTPTPTPAPTPVPVVVTEPLPVVKTPEIVLGNKYGTQAIFGTSGYGQAQVLLSFVSADGTKIFITGTTDSDGSFVLLVPHILKHGAYTVSATIVKADGTKSDSSNQIVTHTGNIFSDVSFGIQVLLVILALASIYLLSYIYFHLKKYKNIPAAMKREVREAENVLHKSFDILREDLTNHIHEKMSTPADRKKVAKLEKEIDDAESVISKEIKDIV